MKNPKRNSHTIRCRWKNHHHYVHVHVDARMVHLCFVPGQSKDAK